jgi:hypothetical protein
VVIEDLQQKWHPALEATQISIHDSASNEFSAPDFSQSMDNPRKLLNERQPYLYQGLQLSEYGIFNATCDPPMSGSASVPVWNFQFVPGLGLDNSQGDWRNFSQSGSFERRGSVMVRG